MRTKTILLTAAVIAAGMAASQAQVYSVNAVGYVNLALPVGYTMIANPLNAPTNTIGALLTGLPNFSNLLKWTGSGFTTATYSFGAWDQPNITLAPGEGAFVNIDTATTVTFVGEVMQGNLTNAIPVGFSIRSSKVPQAGGVTSVLGLSTLGQFDNLLQWKTNKYVSYTYAFGAWDPSEPQIGVGESFFLNTGAATSWNRTFSVN